MELAFKTLLFFHVIFGGSGLFTGTLVMIMNKGDKNHFLLGKIFTISMILSSIAGLILSILHRNLFLLIIAVFTLYLVGTGQRFLKLKKLAVGQKPEKIDYILTFTMLVFGIGFVLYGLTILFSSSNFGWVLFAFGSISLLMARSDFRLYRGISKFKNDWLLVHIQRMTGAYIASFTAFLVVNNTYLPSVLAWLLPTVLFTPLIYIWSKKRAVLKN